MRLSVSPAHIANVNAYIPAAESLARARILEQARREGEDKRYVNLRFVHLMKTPIYARLFLDAMNELLVPQGLRVKWPPPGVSP